MTGDLIPIVNGLTLDLARGCLMRGGEPIHLRPQSYEVLKFLVENQGRLISKDTLIAHVWEGRAVTDGSLGKCIEEVREALGPDARQSLRNVRGRGYIFEPTADITARSSTPGEPWTAMGEPRVSARRRYVTATPIVATALVIVSVIGLWV